ncbi:MAG: SDR family oxidoreductase [Planctomycetes bacterium]|nr:SDR family oxidoreductase [Planctomycetota bacterium]
MDLQLAGRVALVAGAGRGIGAASALRLAKEGARVGVLSRTAEQVEAVTASVREAGGEALPLVCDARDSASVEAALATLKETWEAPTLIVSCLAAHFQPAKLHNLSDEAQRDLLETDVLATTRLLQRAIPPMMLAKHGRVVLIGSLAASTGVGGGPLYALAKSALEGLARGMAIDYSRYGLTFNVVRPGFTDTERFVQRVGEDPEWRQRLVRNTSTRRITSAEEVAALVAFLCSSHAGSITGSVVDITAGTHLNNLW